MGTFNYTSNDVEYNQVGQSYYTATGDISEGNIGNDHNVAVDGLTIGIPLITSGNLGCTIFFRNTGADANNIVSISPKNTNKIIGGMTQAAAVFHASGALGKDLQNTKATSKTGDWVALRAVSLTEWYIIGGQGIWVSES
tara:strand:- start:2088 stop:2507 length:420 start_codon:yes stop_codon:yes gene_type:complete